jgi:DNA mismatch endonuclease (patch repair protein)
MEDGPLPAPITDRERSALMSRVRQSGTTPELMVARTLRGLGIGYRKNARDLPGSPDFVNRGRRWAIFVNGCYWHHHRCRRGTIPKRNRDFWVSKFAANRRRDARAIHDLRRKGFDVILVWECEVMAGGPMFSKLRRLAR